MWLMLWAGRLDCLLESEEEVFASSKGDIGIEEPSGGIAEAISGNREVRLKLDKWGVMPEEFAMGIGVISVSSG